MNNFLFGGLCAGLKKSKKKDLGLIFCEQPCVVGGVFTQNRYPSPHVLYGREILPSQNIFWLIQGNRLLVRESNLPFID